MNPVTGTPFSKFADVCRKVESTTGRNDKVAVLAEFLKSLRHDEILVTVTFLTGHVFPESDKRVLDVGSQTIWRMDRRSNQSTLLAESATILEVYETFGQIAKVSGARSRSKKGALIDTLVGRLRSSDVEYLIRIIHGELRIGAVEGVVLEAIARASNLNVDAIRRSYMLLGDLGKVARLALMDGATAIQATNVQLFVPIRPMVAEMATDFDEVFREHGGITGLEYKYDGARIQIHAQNKTVRIFSRRLTDVTDSLPDIVALVKDRILGRASNFLVEGEVVAVGQDRKPLPFQNLMRRFRRVHEIPSMATKIPLKLHLFDIIYLNDKMLIDEPYEERWQILQNLVGNELLAKRIVTGKLNEAKAMMEQATQAGHEGVMAKDLKSNYTPGVRGKKWFKIKPAETIDAVIVAADWGSGRRNEWLSNYHLAVRDDETGEYLIIGKTFKGLTDEEFVAVTKRLLDLRTKETEYTVFVKPSIVVEVTFNEIQRSPHYKSAFALRFARITRFRDDKRPENADTLKRLKTLYEHQFSFKARIGGI
jgi:DNA ligase-1